MSQKSVNPNQILLTPQKHGIRTNNKYVTLKCNGHEQKYITIFGKTDANAEISQTFTVTGMTDND